MNEKNLKKIINNRLGTRLFLVIIILFLILFPLESYINNKIIARSHKIITSTTSNILENLNNYLLQFERGYNNLFLDLLRELAFDEEQLLLGEELSATDIKNEINNFIDQRDNSLEIKADKIDYFLISSTGMIKETSIEKYPLNDFTENKKIWSELQELERGEVILQRVAFSNFKKRRNKNSYLKLGDGFILKLSYPFAQDIFDYHHKQINNKYYMGIKNIGVYSSAPDFSTIKQGLSPLDAQDRKALKKLAKMDKNYIKGVGNKYYQPIYIRWDLEAKSDNVLAETVYLKIKTDVSKLKLIKYAILLLSGGFLVIVSVLMMSFNKQLYDKVLDPFSSLITNMNQFSNQDNYDDFEVADKLQRTEIKEVNTLLATYQDMINELSSNFEELELINKELDDSYQELELVNERFKELVKVPGCLMEAVFNNDYDQFLSELIYYGIQIIPRVDYGSVFILKDDYWHCLETIGHQQGLETIKVKENCLSKFTATTFVSSYEQLLTNNCNQEQKNNFLKYINPVKESIISDLKVGENLKIRLILDIAIDEPDKFAKQDQAVMSAYNHVATATLTMYQYNELQKKFQEEIVFTIINVLELHDGYTKGHSEDVAKISVKLAQELGLNKDRMDDIYWAGLVHDIGKILISRGILNKPTSLTDEEYKEIKKHPVFGYKVLNDAEELAKIADLIKYHHENWDGSGYPEGLEGEEIPLVSRILSVADAWNAMTSNRIYRDKLLKEEAIKELKDNKGSQFAPQVVDAALELFERGEL